MSEPSTIPFRTALRFWLKLGFISFGGPAGQISIMHDELVERRKWVSERRFLNALNFTMLLPGPEAQQLATYIGWLMHGVVGGLVAGLLFVLPSFFILALLAWLYLEFGETTLLAGVLYGVKPAVIAIVVFAAWRIGSRALRNALQWGLACASFIAMTFFAMPFPAIILASAAIGLTVSLFAPEYFAAQSHDSSTSENHAPAIIGDDTPLPAHARFKWSRVMLFVVIGVGLWGIVLLGLIWTQGWQATLTQMGWFFTKAALLTFGGAYAVLPYVYQGGVETFGWLNAAQMIDGLALGETTPGPLIMIVTFVGFVGGWGSELGVSVSPQGSAWLAAAVATFFTFLPSFLFIFIGGPAVEAARRQVTLAAPLGAITAAVVGVILNLAVYFGLHVLWPAGLDSEFDWVAVILVVMALVALLRLRVGIMSVIAVAAAIGLVLQFLQGV